MYNKGEVKVDGESKGRLLALLRAFPKDEPTKKKFVGEMVAWSSRFGDFPAGDPEIHHVAGGLYAEGELYSFLFAFVISTAVCNIPTSKREKKRR